VKLELIVTAEARMGEPHTRCSCDYSHDHMTPHYCAIGLGHHDSKTVQHAGDCRHAVESGPLTSSREGQRGKTAIAKPYTIKEFTTEIAIGLILTGSMEYLTATGRHFMRSDRVVSIQHGNFG
jgi:hypothetical protein